MEVLRVSTF